MAIKDCPDCDGTGKIICIQCRGTGEGPETFAGRKICPKCDGKGWKLCPKCLCQVCGLPKDLCVCEEIAREKQRIGIR